MNESGHVSELVLKCQHAVAAGSPLPLGEERRRSQRGSRSRLGHGWRQAREVWDEEHVGPDPVRRALAPARGARWLQRRPRVVDQTFVFRGSPQSRGPSRGQSLLLASAGFSGRVHCRRTVRSVGHGSPTALEVCAWRTPIWASDKCTVTTVVKDCVSWVMGALHVTSREGSGRRAGLFPVVAEGVGAPFLGSQWQLALWALASAGGGGRRAACGCRGSAAACVPARRARLRAVRRRSHGPPGRTSAPEAAGPRAEPSQGPVTSPWFPGRHWAPQRCAVGPRGAHAVARGPGGRVRQQRQCWCRSHAADTPARGPRPRCSVCDRRGLRPTQAVSTLGLLRPCRQGHALRFRSRRCAERGVRGAAVRAARPVAVPRVSAHLPGVWQGDPRASPERPSRRSSV